MWKHWKRALEHDPHHLPVAGHRIFAGRRFRHSPNGADRRVVPFVDTNGGDAVQAKRPKRRNAKRHLLGDMAKRVAALVAVRRSVRQLTDADAVEHDDDGASERHGWVM